MSDFRSNEIIGERQFEAARTLMKGKSLEQLVGPVKGLHTFVDMWVQVRSILSISTQGIYY